MIKLRNAGVYDYKMVKDDKTTFIFSTYDPKIMKHASGKIILTDGIIDKIL